MSKDTNALSVTKLETPEAITEQNVADYLRQHRDFFERNQDLLAELSFPHETGKAISLLERQVTILRNRGTDARAKLSHLLDNARNNDQLFETTRDLVLALLRSRDQNEIVQIAQDRLSQQDNIDRCEIIMVERPGLKLETNVRTAGLAQLQQDFADVFRLMRTHCGNLSEKQMAFLFPGTYKTVHSTALCPVLCNGEVLALLALGNSKENYFNINLDTLFLDFIANVTGAVLGHQILAVN